MSHTVEDKSQCKDIQAVQVYVMACAKAVIANETPSFNKESAFIMMGLKWKLDAPVKIISEKSNFLYLFANFSDLKKIGKCIPNWWIFRGATIDCLEQELYLSNIIAPTVSRDAFLDSLPEKTVIPVDEKWNIAVVGKYVGEGLVGAKFMLSPNTSSLWKSYLEF